MVCLSPLVTLFIYVLMSSFHCVLAILITAFHNFNVLFIRNCKKKEIFVSNYKNHRNRKRGAPKITWSRTIEAELAVLDITWGQVQVLARDRPKLREIVVALCPIGDEDE